VTNKNYKCLTRTWTTQITYNKKF